MGHHATPVRLVCGDGSTMGATIVGAPGGAHVAGEQDLGPGVVELEIASAWRKWAGTATILVSRMGTTMPASGNADAALRSVGGAEWGTKRSTGRRRTGYESVADSHLLREATMSVLVRRRCTSGFEQEKYFAWP